MTKYSFNIGALLGLALILIEIIGFTMGLEESTVLSIIGYLVLAAGLIFGIKNYRDNSLNGFISYGQSVKLGSLISIAASILLGVFLYIYFKFVDSTFLTNLLDVQIEELYAQEGLTDDQLEMSISMMKNFTSPGVVSFISFIGESILGIIFSLIISAFMKNEEPLFTEEG